MRMPVPVDWSYRYLRKFHGAASRTFVPTLSQKCRLQERGFDNVVIWGRGVDTDIFQPGDDIFPDLPRPMFLTAGRVAVEKNIRVFLDMKLPGSKVVVGDGPDLQQLRKLYPQVIFTGYKFGTDLARHIASADVFVFPSMTDTFGIVLLEAMACGVPVAAYPVTGPRDVVIHGTTGMLGQDLQQAAIAALDLAPDKCIEFAKRNSWTKCTATFLENMVPLFNAPHGQLLTRSG
jgi:glycosyltransferase involved in cell wall biosynthesis